MCLGGTIRDQGDDRGYKMVYTVLNKVDPSKQSRLCRCSLFVVEDMNERGVFTGSNVKLRRLGKGFCSDCQDSVFGRIATRDLQKGKSIRFDVIEEFVDLQNE